MKGVVALVFVLFLSGCSKNSIEDKMVDLSGLVFLTSIAVVGLKIFSYSAVMSDYFKKWRDLIFKKINYLYLPMYLVASIFFAFGFVGDGLDKVMSLSGVSLFLSARSLHMVSSNSNSKDRVKLLVEISITGVVFSFILAAISLFGEEVVML